MGKRIEYRQSQDGHHVAIRVFDSTKQELARRSVEYKIWYARPVGEKSKEVAWACQQCGIDVGYSKMTRNRYRHSFDWMGVVLNGGFAALMNIFIYYGMYDRHGGLTHYEQLFADPSIQASWAHAFMTFILQHDFLTVSIWFWGFMACLWVVGTEFRAVSGLAKLLCKPPRKLSDKRTQT